MYLHRGAFPLFCFAKETDVPGLDFQKKQTDRMVLKKISLNVKKWID